MSEPPDKKEPPQDTTGNYMEVLSHQLKSPINAIQSMLATILEGFSGGVEPQAKYFIERSLKRAAEASELITDLLDYQRFSSEGQSFDDQIDLGQLLGSLITRQATALATKGVALEDRLVPEQRILVGGNAAALSNALRNVIDNAIKYTPDGGRVTVALRLVDNKRCVVDVADTGPGIPESERELIFKPFFRAKNLSASISGTGLGLPIARAIIESHKGTLTVESPEHGGTLFRFELPYAAAEERTEVASHNRTRVVIVGGVTSGPKAAARLRRLDETMDLTIIEKSELFSYAGCGLPYYISGRAATPKALMASADNSPRDVEWFATIKNIRVLNRTEATAIDRQRKVVEVKNLSDGVPYPVPYDVLILATGASAHRPAIAGIDQEGVYTFYNIEDAEAIRNIFRTKRAQDVCIIGGGLIGTESAESLVVAGARVTILEARRHIMSNLLDEDISVKVENELMSKGIKVLTGVRVTAVEKKGDRFSIAHGTGHTEADLVILAAGVDPNAGLAKDADLVIGESGGIKVDAWLRTSDESIYAVGDCAETVNTISGRHEYWPLGSISTKMGRIAADNICGRPMTFDGFIGTAMVKVFDICVARTGLTSADAADAGFDVETATVVGSDKSAYTGNAHMITLKLIAERGTRRVIGAQGFGVDIFSRFPTIACAITNSMTLEQLFKMDFGYTPAFNTSIDILQTAALVLTNKLDGLLETVTVEECNHDRLHAECHILDVSPVAEYAVGAIPTSLNVPLESLRFEGVPFGREEKIVVYSKTSAGAYEAYRYLKTRGYTNVRVLEGGYAFWQQ